jgi:SAM-dependent methyltransferase
MRAEDFELLYKLEESYWWFAGMRNITDAVIAPQFRNGRPLRILDAGCGTGFNLTYYESRGEVYGLDVAAEAVEGVHRRGFRRLAQASVTEIPFRSGAFDLVFSFDVICQLPVSASEQGILEMHRVLKPGGSLFIRVPAFEWLRSSHDEDLHTFHRFTREELVKSLRDAGFHVRWSSYANTLLFPVAALKRLLKHIGVGHGTDVRPLPSGLAWLDPIFRGLLLREAKIFKSGKTLPVGLSVICVAEKDLLTITDN